MPAQAATAGPSNRYATAPTAIPMASELMSTSSRVRYTGSVHGGTPSDADLLQANGVNRPRFRLFENCLRQLGTLTPYRRPSSVNAARPAPAWWRTSAGSHRKLGSRATCGSQGAIRALAVFDPATAPAFLACGFRKPVCASNGRRLRGFGVRQHALSAPSHNDAHRQQDNNDSHAWRSSRRLWLPEEGCRESQFNGGRLRSENCRSRPQQPRSDESEENSRRGFD